MKKMDTLLTAVFTVLILCCLCPAALAECPENGHTISTRRDPEPGCETYGKLVTYCTVCGKVLDSQNIRPVGHQLRDVVDVKPTCKSEGSQHTECAVCGKYMYSTVLYKTGHDFGEWHSVRAATCKEEGKEERVCAVCGTVESRAVACLPHTEETVILTAPTCTKKGTAEKRCSVCLKVLRTGVSVPATGHDYTGWTVVTAASCAEKGLEERVCRSCNHSETRSLPKLGHDFGAWTRTLDPTCTDAGKEERVCSRCGKTETKTVKKLGHQFGGWTVTQKAACTQPGEKVRECSRCHEKETKQIPATNHAGSYWETTVKATATRGGHRRKVCPDCGQVLKEEDTSPIRYRNNTICAEGTRLRDAGISDDWYMFAPVDVSKDGSTTLELVASNLFRVGTVNVLVQEGTVTVSLFIPSKNVDMTQPFFTLVPDMRQLPSYQPEDLIGDWALPFDEPLSLEGFFPGEKELCLYVCCRADYTYDSRLMTMLP